MKNQQATGTMAVDVSGYFCSASECSSSSDEELDQAIDDDDVDGDDDIIPFSCIPLSQQDTAALESYLAQGQQLPVFGAH